MPQKEIYNWCTQKSIISHQPIYYIESTTYPSKAMSSSLESLDDFSDGIVPEGQHSPMTTIQNRREISD